MDEVTAFERQIGDELRREIGPMPGFDTSAVVRSVVATTPRGRWSVGTRFRGRASQAPTQRGFSMHAALRFVAASVTVALFGGFLLAGVLTTQQGDEMAPAAVTESPSPMMTEELLSGMVTEEIEPGVHLVVSDGFHHLTPDIDAQEGFPAYFVDVAPDGGVWHSGGGDSGDGLYRLGDDSRYEDAGGAWGPSRHHLFAPDGTFWAYSGDSVRTFADGVWVVRRLHGLHIDDLAVGPDGEAWALAMAEDSEGSQGHSVLRLAKTVDAGWAYRTVEGWRELGDAIYFRPEAIEVTPDGTIWLLGADRAQVQLLRFADERWQIVDTPASPLAGAQPRDLAAGPDGSLWLVGGHRDADLTLLRLDRDGWSTIDERGAGIGWGHGIGVFFGSYLLDVAPDGALWLNAHASDTLEHAGVARFDGITWQRFLDGRSVHDLDAGPDGAVWVRAKDASTEGPIHTYVITPEAVGGTE